MSSGVTSRHTLKGNDKKIDQSTIPPAVRRAAEEAERLQQQYAANPDAPIEPTNQNEPPAPAPAPTNPNEPPRPTNPEPQPPVTSQGNPPASEQRPQPTNPNPPQGEDENDIETWKQRARSEQGRNQKLREQVNTLSETVSNLQGVMATMGASTPQAPAEMHFEPKRYVTAEEEAEWTPQLLDVVGRKAQEIAEAQLAPLKAQIEALGGTVNNVTTKVAKSARDEMLSTLDANEKIHGWRIINDDPEFVQWLKYPDAMSGQIRHDMLLSAFNSNDASRVAAFFEGFLRETAAVAPRTEPSQGNPAPEPKPSLETFAAPGRTRSSTTQPTAGAEQEIITRADIARFYADKAAGRFKGIEDKADAYEQQIFKAQREGRIPER